MLVYLSKKIAIPNQIKLNCISWNRDQGYVACGGGSGLLKVFKLEAASGSVPIALKGVAAQSNLSMNLTLEGHTGGVMCTTWNPLFRKLTTSDESGLIIVWTLHKGVWCEEMINNRNKSVVRDMKWTSDGKKICIVYEDGAVIVGSVDGNRIWGKELNMPLRFVEWSPDSKLIFFVTMDSEIWIYDSEGNRIRSMSLSALDPTGSSDLSIVGVHWHCQDGPVRVGSGLHYTHAEANPTLCIALQSGMILLSRGDEDNNSIVVNTEMVITCCKWDTSGNVLAITGALKNSSEKVINQIKFYDPYGKHLRTTRIPGDNIVGISWEGGSLRLALAVDSHIFFANVRPAYTWAYLLNTVVYAFSRADKRESGVVFWDLTTGEFYLKFVTGLKFIVACGEFCALILAEKDEKIVAGSDKPTYTYRIQLRNAIGAVVDAKKIPFAPKTVSMGPYHVAAMNDRVVYTWQFQSLVSKSGLGSSSISELSDAASSNRGQQGSSKNRERIFDIESTELSSAQAPETFKMQYDAIADPIVCSAIDDKFLVVARRGGSITRYTLPHLSPENTYNTKCEPFLMKINCTSSRIAVIDVAGVLSVLDLDARLTEFEEKENKNALGPYYGRRLAIERRDVWNICWAEDNDEMFCVMEKTKIIVYRNEVAEEPVVSSGYLARFKNLEVRSVLLDELLVRPEQPDRECVIDHETKSLREARERIVSDGLQGGYSYADKAPHPRLWKLLAETALEELDLAMAERAFVRCGDYYGIQLVKHLRAICSVSDKMKARAEVAVYLRKFDEAESIYREIDRKDLAIQMRRKLGDDNRVVQLLQTGGGNDQLMRDAWNRIGEFHADRFKWKKAASYFQQSRNYERLTECYCRLEDFESLSGLREHINDGSHLFGVLASRFESVGMYEEAVDCHLRMSNPKAAVDCCISLNRWDKALELAEQHQFQQVEGLLTRYAEKLFTSNKRLEAVELYRRANRPTEAAQLICEIAEQAARRDVKPSLAKKLHVLSALEVERHRKRAMDQATNATLNGTTGGTAVDIAQATAATLETLMMTSLDTQTGGTTMMTAAGTKKASKAFQNAWRGAAAYHYFMLAQRQMYSGNADAAMRTSIKLCEYDDILDQRAVYSLLCLASLRTKFYGICSKGFVKLETLQELSETVRDDIQTLAVQIFVEHAPIDPAALPEPYLKCLELGIPFKACVITGRAIQDSPVISCRTCRHPMLEDQRGYLQNCPLCHSSLLSTTINPL